MSPRVVLLFSGKRKSGKDYLTDHLQQLLKDKCEIIKISAPIKHYWAKQNNLNFNELLSNSDYKELHRLEMIRWSDSIREKDYGYFCRQACKDAKEKPIWIVSDIRRKTDIRWFKDTYKDLVRTIHIEADEETRKSRGFHYKDGVDNVASECDLDDFHDWDLVINNGEGGLKLQDQMDSILALCKNLL
ncbi:unnamed protein product [Diatraea saccharalis]|uniref:Phosphomevalonate kinase n=1 Tax=Diatraea saccharalis TaxID=40085 RepID=A0A9P0G220_9NEOP|nr:unnamed protein product [Diatraea saccharalis]